VGTLITHTDLDGITCAILHKVVYPDWDIKFVDYNEVNNVVADLVDKPGDITITDLSVNPAVALMLDSRNSELGTVRLFDHHKTVEWLREYSWAIVKTEMCGALVYGNFLSITAKDALLPYRPLMTYVDDYDRWVHRYDESRQLSRLFGLLGRERFITRFLDNPSPVFTGEEKLLLSVEERRIREYCKDRNNEVVEITQDNVKFGWVFCSQYISEVGEYILRQRDIDYVALVNPEMGTVSLRSAGRADVSVIAKARGGGGHPAASGYPILGYTLAAFVDSVLDREC